MRLGPVTVGKKQNQTLEMFQKTDFNEREVVKWVP